ncbi:F-box protein CPR30 [Forsythia ovata]|uniref:F-box protein CPR30 n=1 Tax=Forsythia ovata TaxID=205694 RepID=A0ABD1S5S2_9LAMI
MAILPLELVVDILCRLPVKPLKRFRCVAKLWCSIIDGQDFVKMHLLQSTTRNSNQNLILGGLGLYCVDLDLLDKAIVIKPPFYYKSVDSISNSCNGLLLVMSEPPVLWNPFSREYRILPDSSVEYPSQFQCYSKINYGLGYDSMNDDYKVVRVVEFRNEISHEWICSETKVYSLKSNLWRRVDDFPYPLPFLKGIWRVHINDALHTLVEDSDNMYLNRSVRIMAFSVETETHYEVPLPPDMLIKDLDMRLDVIGGCLCVVCNNKYRVNIWVMKKYGVSESWTKLLSIGVTKLEPNHIVRPLVYSEDDNKVLLNCDDKRLVWYDLRSKTTEHINISGLPFVFYAEVCVESLIPLDGFDGIDGIKKQGQEKRKKKNCNTRDDFLSEGFKLVL